MRNAVFVIRLSKPAPQPVTLNYATQDGTAIAPIDYTSASGEVALSVGQSIAQIVVAVRDAAPGDAEKYFNLSISVVSGATVSRALAKCTLPQMSFTAQPVVKSNSVIVASET